MLITLWVFIGVEGAIVISSRARNKKDVGRATMLAVFSALSIYLLITLLSLGVIPRAELAEMHNPSMAGLMVELIGPLGKIVIATGLIISVCGAYLSWAIMAAGVPMLAAKQGSFPKIFRHQNANNAPVYSLWLTNGAVQVSLLIIWLTGSNYNTLLTIASEMILVPYFLVGAFLFKIAYQRQDWRLITVASGACLYGLWLIYAAGLVHLLLSVLLYAPGLLVFIYARKGHGNLNLMNRLEKTIIFLVLFATIPATWVVLN